MYLSAGVLNLLRNFLAQIIWSGTNEGFVIIDGG